jgi:hypothetical protein
MGGKSVAHKSSKAIRSFTHKQQKHNTCRHPRWMPAFYLPMERGL